MQIVLKYVAFLGICFCVNALVSLPSKAQSNETKVSLEDAREALKAEPGNSQARKAFTAALQESINSARREGDTDATLTLVEEYLAQLNLRLSTDPTSVEQRWARFSVLRIKWQTLFQQDQYPEAALEAIRAAEKDIRFLADAKPDTLRYKEELARTLSLIGWSAQEVSDRSLPDAAHREAVALARTILTESPKSVNASLALAYGLQWNAMSVTAKDKTYEAYETSVPLYKEAILAFKNLAKLEPGNKGYATDHAQVWYGLGQIYHELGDDEEAFKAIRLSYYLLQDASDAHPNDANLHRRAYQLGLHTSEFLSFGEERLAWLERMKSRLKEIEAIGKLHPDDKTLIDEVDRQIGLNKDVIETSKE